MTHSKRHKVIITGTGRAGTTFLVQLLTTLGLDTGYTMANWRKDYHDHCAAGLEHDLADPAAPYIVKNPGLCDTLPAVLAREPIVIDHALIPIRRLDDATLSRVRVGGNGRTPGGLAGTRDAGQQKAVLAERFHLLIETLTAHDIPHTFLHFPRFASDADYAYAKLRPVLGNIEREHFLECFAQVARPDLIHSFAAGQPADAGKPARLFARNRRARRWWRYITRAAAAGALIGLGWKANDWMDDDDAPAVRIEMAAAPNPPRPEFPATPRIHVTPVTLASPRFPAEEERNGGGGAAAEDHLSR